MRPSLRKTLWAFAVVFALHEAEEWNLVAWFRTHFTPEPGFTAVRGLGVVRAR